MKTKLFLIAFVVFGLVSCEDLRTVNIDTTLSTELNAEVVDNQAVTVSTLKSTNDLGYPFLETEVIDLSENDDLKDYLDDINELEVYSVTCKLNGIPDGEVINELTVFSIMAGLDLTLTNLTENNSTIELDINASVLKALGDQLLQNEEIEVGVSGYSSYAPMVLNVELSFETKVKAKVI